jgi:hypothetical protein
LEVLPRQANHQYSWLNIFWKNFLREVYTSHLTLSTQCSLPKSSTETAKLKPGKAKLPYRVNCKAQDAFEA